MQVSRHEICVLVNAQRNEDILETSTSLGGT